MNKGISRRTFSRTAAPVAISAGFAGTRLWAAQAPTRGANALVTKRYRSPWVLPA